MGLSLPAQMDSHVSNTGPVRYDPLLTKMRHENEQLRLDVERRSSQERELRKRLERAERRIQEGTSFMSKEKKTADVLRHHNEKLERQIKDLKKYLARLPTRDEYTALQNEKRQLLEANGFMKKELQNIKEKIQTYTHSVDEMGKDKVELTYELELAHNKITELQTVVKESQSSNAADDSDLIDVLRAQCKQLALKLKEEKAARVEELNNHQGERDRLSQTVSTFQAEHA